MDYGDILYHQPNNESMSIKQESVQYSAALFITVTIKRISTSKLYKELGLESGLPTYLFNLIPKSNYDYQTRTSGNIPTYQCRTRSFKNFLFPWTIVTWNKIHPETRNAFLTVFKKHLLKEICLVPHLVYNISHPNGLELLPRLRLGLSKNSSLTFLV